VACVAADVARAGGSARATYTHQVQEYLAVLADLIDNPDRQVGEREAVLTLSVLVGAISMARAVDDPDLSQQILTNAAAALKERIPS
jgi:TetR/AcrR family transcriptional repressor of nem operon